jgi:hypothetical protein
MKLKVTTNPSRAKSRNCQTGSVCLLAVLFVVSAVTLSAQSFSSGSNGSDGAYSPSGPAGTIIVFDPTQFHGSQVSANIFNFTTVTIPAGVTIRFSGNTVNGPIFWLTQGDVDIEGTLDLSGGNGASFIPTTASFERQPSVPGSGGFAGGVGGNLQQQAALPGSGIGGGAAGVSGSQVGLGGKYSGDQLLIPLVGGSGGGGGAINNSSTLEAGGGAGGGAILIASSTQITVNGSINVNGGQPGRATAACAGGGSGGAMRLVSNLIAGTGTLSAAGGQSSQCSGNIQPGGVGVIREESSTTFFPGTVNGTVFVSTPIQLLLPTAGSPTASVISINGTPVTPNPSTFPDITINTTAPVPVIIETQNIPANATITLTILDENNVPDTVITAPPLSNCTSNVCTTTVNVTFPFGGSFGLTKVNWTVQ